MVLSAPGRRDVNGEKTHDERWAGARRNDGKPRAAKRRCPLHGIDAVGVIDDMREAQETARQSGAAGTAAASDDVLRHGMDTRCPGGAGQRQRAGSVRSMKARPDAKTSQQASQYLVRIV